MKTKTDKHTPGPWEVERDGQEVRIVARLTDGRDGSGYTIARCYSLKADTALIAAAPELLAACQEALLQLLDSDGQCSNCHGTKNDHNENCVSVKLAAAIAKAEGREGR